MKYKNLSAVEFVNLLTTAIMFFKNNIPVKYLLFKPSYYFSRKLLILFILILAGLNSYSQTYKINDYNGQTVNTCSGTFYDSGVKPGGFYGDNENYTVTFCSNNGNALKFAFSLFKVEVNDTLIVYDGPDISSPVFRKYTGESLPPFSINSTGTCFTFVFKSNSLFFREGWVAAISCCPPPVISAIVPSVTRLCAGSTVNYSVDNHAGSTYNWTIINGTPSSVTGGTNNLDVTWDLNGDITGLVKVVEVNSCGSKDSTELIVDIDKLPPVNFSGLAAYYCVYSPSVTLTGFPAGGTFSGTGITGNTFNPALAGAGTHNITYFYTDPSTSCSNQRTIQTTVDVPSVFIVSASATSYCAGSGVSIILSDSEAGVNYQLKLNGADDGPLMAGTGSPLTWTNKTQGVYTVVAISTLSLCNNNMTGSPTITENPLPIPSFVSQPGAATCSADNVTYVTQAGQSNYVWGFPGVSGTDYIISSGGGLTNNDVTLRWLTAGSKSVTINYTNSNGCTATSPASSSATIVTINPGPPTGSPLQAFCSETSPEVSDLVAAGSSIRWYTAASGGSLLPAATPLTNGTHYFASQTINGCESATRLDVTATVSSIPLPPVANPGSGAGCSQITANWTASALATSYRLDLSTVNTFATYVAGYQDLNVGNVTTLNIAGLTAGITYYYRIRAVNYCGTSPNSNIITYATLPAIPAIPGPITGIVTQCAALPGQVYSIVAVPNAINYTWSVPSGWTITSGQGTVSVTVTTGAAGQNGNVSVTAGNSCGTSAARILAVTVNPNASITSVTGLSPLCIGATSVYTANGVVLSGGTGAWSSSNPAVATVSAAGLVTGITAGTSNIIYTITGGCGGVVSAQRSVTINPNSAITSVTGTTPLCIGATSTYTANGVILSGGTGAWSSSNPAVATVSAAGLVTGITAGTSNIIYTITGGCSGPVSAQQSVTITPNASITSVTGTSPLCIGATSTYTANGVVLSGGTGAWSSSNPAVATVSAAGLVTGITAGTSNIIYTITGGCGGVVSAQRSVTINPNAAITSVTGTSPLCVGATSVYAANGVVLSGGTGAWSSSNPAVATVSAAGLVTGITAGTSNIIYTITGGCGGVVSAQQSVTINPNSAITSVSGTSPLCIGTTSVYTANGVVLSGGTGAWSSSNPAVATVSAAGLVTGITAGTSNIIYTITGGCSGPVSAQQAVTISPNAAITSVTGSSPLCIGATSVYAANGVVLSGGTGAWSSSNPAVATVSAAGLVTGITAGTSNIIYTITGGCGGTVSAQRAVTVGPNSSIISVTGVSPLCIGATTLYTANGVVLGGGTGAWSSSNPAIASVNSSGLVTSLSPGTCNIIYTITGGCGGPVTSQASITVSPNAGIVSMTSTSPLCIGGSAIFTANGVVLSGGAGAWSSSNPAIATVDATGLVTGVSAGISNIIYTITGGCGGVVSAQQPVTINQNASVTSVTGLSPLCIGATTPFTANGVVLSGGTGAWSSSNPAVASVNASGLVTGISAGNSNIIYTITGGCGGVVTASGNLIVTGVPAATISYTGTPWCSNEGIKNVIISGTPGGSFTAAPAGLTIDPVTGAIDPGASLAGTYTVTYTISAVGCSIVSTTTSVTINQVPTVVISNPAAICVPATVDLTAASVTTGSTPGLTFTYWIDAVATIPLGTPNSAGSGVYYIKGTDGSNCYDIQPVTVTVNPVPSVTGTQTDILCSGASTGAIDITVTGGTGPYSYTWSGTGVNVSSEDQSGLAAGLYSVVVTDANLCSSVLFQVTLTEPTALSGSITAQTNVTVFGGNDGSVTVDGSGGVSPYQYRIASGTFQSSGTFGMLTAGNYTVTVQDVNLCTYDVSVTITQPLPPVSGSITSQTDVACFGASSGSVTVQGASGLVPYEYSLNGGAYQPSGTFGTLASGPYTVTIRDANLNTFDVAVSIIQPASAVNGSITSQTNVLCFGSNTGSVTVTGSGGVAPYLYKLGAGAYQVSGTFGSLIAGNYIVTVQDANLCIFDIPVVITQPATALTGSIFTQANVLCSGAANGSVTITAAGGTAPYQYRLNGGTPQPSGTFVNLSAATYTITVVDANMCTANVSVIITQPQAIAISFTKEDATCPGEPDGSITLTISGGTSPYSVIWSDGIITQDRTDIPDGNYSVVVTDFNGCASSLDIVVGFIGTGSCLEVLNIITPNGDGYNDTWKIKNIDLFPDAEVFVYNRWGKLVFTTKNLSANDWDGTSGGKDLPTDSYHYILNLHDGSETKSGVISIIR